MCCKGAPGCVPENLICIQIFLLILRVDTQVYPYINLPQFFSLHDFYTRLQYNCLKSKGNNMKQTFQVVNVKCGGCANTLKEKLSKEFGEVEVDLEKEPREITLDIDKEQLPALAKALKKLGYPLVTEKMGFIDGTSAKAKSYVSCAIGKMNN